MDQETWRKISEMFSDYVECAESERPILLANLQTTDPVVAREIRVLLKAYEQNEDFLETPGIYQEAELPVLDDETKEESGFAPELRAHRVRGTRRKSLAFWLLLGANLAILGCFVFALMVIGHYRGTAASAGWWADPTAKGWVVTEVESPGPASGVLQPGDHVVQVNHKPIWLPELISVRAGDAYSLRILREVEIRDVILTKQTVANRRWFAGTLSYLLVSITYFLTAVVVSIMQPRPRITRLAWAALSGEAVTLLCMLMRPYEAFLAGGSYLFFSCMQLVDGPHLAFSFHFYGRVFRGGRPTKGSALLVWMLYAWGIGGAIYRAFLLTRHSFDPFVSFFWSHLTLWHAIDVFEGVFYMVAPLSICIAVAHCYLRAQGPEEQRRAAWIAVGSLAGILPYLALRWASALGLTGADYAGIYGILPAALIPLATGYAILKHRLFDIHVVLRRGVQYLVARNFLRFVLALPALALACSLITNANRTVGEVVLHNWIFISMAALIAVVLRFRERLSSWLDRRFFRERYPQERILLALIESLRTVDSAPEMGRRVVAELTEALHPESVHFFYYSPEDRAYVKGFGTDSRADGVRIPERSALPLVLAKSEDPVNVQSLPLLWVPVMSWTWLHTLRTDLIVPLNRADGSLDGFLLLGRKKSEEEYSPTDRTLLLGLARQMAVVYENLLLQQRLLWQQRSNEKMRARVESVGTNWLQECPQCGRCFDCCIRACVDDGSELVLSMPVQRILDGRYRLDRVLGRGGMGTVFAAQDLLLNRRVAVKLVQAGRISDSAWLRRFSREARALARLQHENIVLMHDFGVVEEEAAYLVMEFVAGATLRAEIDSGGINANTAPVWFHQLLEGVKAAHAAGIVHRDLKPENVLIARPGSGRECVKIADFGVAKWLTPEPGSVSLTVPGTIVGSLHYMSPEQLAGQQVDRRSDIFSIGVMVFEALTGKIPFGGTNYAERIVSILQESASFECSLHDAPALQTTLRRCLARDPDERFSSVEALQTELIPRIQEYRSHIRGLAQYA